MIIGEIFAQYNHIKMDEYIIMPDHFHGIIRILHDSQLNGEKRSLHDSQLDVRAGLPARRSHQRWRRRGPPARPRAIQKQRAGQVPPVHFDQNHFKKLDLSHIIGAFKTSSSKMIHKAGYLNFKWKRSFHDRIIRNDELEIKRKYIKNNPMN